MNYTTVKIHYKVKLNLRVIRFASFYVSRVGESMTTVDYQQVDFDRPRNRTSFPALEIN